MIFQCKNKLLHFFFRRFLEIKPASSLRFQLAFGQQFDTEKRTGGKFHSEPWQPAENYAQYSASRHRFVELLQIY